MALITLLNCRSNLSWIYEHTSFLFKPVSAELSVDTAKRKIADKLNLTKFN
jgi:hypothetical protein